MYVFSNLAVALGRACYRAPDTTVPRARAPSSLLGYDDGIQFVFE